MTGLFSVQTGASRGPREGVRGQPLERLPERIPYAALGQRVKGHLPAVRRVGEGEGGAPQGDLAAAAARLSSSSAMSH